MYTELFETYRNDVIVLAALFYLFFCFGLCYGYLLWRPKEKGENNVSK